MLLVVDILHVWIYKNLRCDVDYTRIYCCILCSVSKNFKILWTYLDIFDHNSKNYPSILLTIELSMVISRADFKIKGNPCLWVVYSIKL